MPSWVTYSIDGEEHTFKIEEHSKYMFGKNEILSTKDNDITFDQPWYNKGYVEESFLNTNEFVYLKQLLTDCIAKIIQEEIGINVDQFVLEDYHHFVKDEISHHKVVSRTRCLFENDFNFPVLEYISRFENILGFRLTDTFVEEKIKMHVIIRINRPGSNDFNPPHKDIYEGYDYLGYIPRFINFWIPIAGVTERTNLPLVPSSHQLNENVISRTFEGGVLAGNQYRVRMIKSWNGQNQLMRSKVKYGEVLIFSSHLIHGLAVNNEIDVTRVALEYRLFKSE